MPIPKIDREISTPEDMDNLMRKSGWVRQLTFEWVEFNSKLNIWICNTYRAEGSKFGTTPRERRFTYLQLTPSGVIRTNALTRCSSSSMIRKKFELINTRRVSVREALRIIKHSGQKQPFGLIADKRYHNISKLLEIKW